MENILLQYTSQSILNRARTKMLISHIAISGGVGPGRLSFDLLIERSDGSLPHTAYIGEDDIWCSCVGFTATLKEKKLCSHLVMGFIKLIEDKVLTQHDVIECLCKWTIMQGAKLHAIDH